MSWTQHWRAHFFGSDINPDLEGSQAQSQEEGDRAFLERYCSDDRPSSKNGRINTGTRSRLDQSPVFQARRVLNWLAKRLPQEDHSTPGWDNKSPELPLVVIGKLTKSNRIWQPRCGICVIDNDLYFWSDKITISSYGILSGSWKNWRNDTPKNPKMVYETAISVSADETVAPPQPIEQFLTAFERRRTMKQLSTQMPKVPRAVNT